MKNETASFRLRVGTILRSASLPLMILIVTVLVAHAFFPTTKSDDAWFLQILEGEKATLENWVSFLTERYDTWSSRIPIEGMLILCVRFPLLWRILNALSCIFLIIALIRLCNPTRSVWKNWILTALFFLFPLWILNEAGYIATTLNYLWPLTAAVWALTPVVKQYQGRETAKWEFALAIGMLLFSSFQEQVCAILLLAYLLSFFYRWVTSKKLPVYPLLCAVFCALMLLYTLTCPGNRNRVMLETAAHFPAHASLHLFQKAELGFSSMVRTLFLRRNLFVAAFCAILIPAVWLRSKRVWDRVLSAIPLFCALIFGLLGDVLSPILHLIPFVRSLVGETGTAPELSRPLSFLPLLTFLLLFGIILYLLYIAIPDRKTYFFAFVLLALGAASRIALGFSPTVWVSGERTCTYLYVAMACVMGGILFRIVRQIQPKGECDNVA